MDGTVKLRDFVGSALTEIIGGIADAQEQVGQKEGADWSRAKIVPNWGNVSDPENVSHIDTGQTVQMVDFDVAVTIGNSEGGSGKAGLVVPGLGVELGAKGEKSAEQTSVSRVRFRVPVAWPSQERSRQPERDAEQQARMERSMGSGGSWME